MKSAPSPAFIFRRLYESDSPEKLWAVANRVVDYRAHGASDGGAGEEILKQANTYVLYGAGCFSSAVILAWKDRNLRPDYCIDGDRRKWGTFLRGVPVLSPQALFEDERRPLVVIAAATTHEIETALEEKGLTYLFAERDGSVGFLSGHLLYQNQSAFNRAYALLADDRSRQVLLEVTKARLFQRFHFLMRGNFFTGAIATFPQYFQPDLVRLSDGEFFVDCGAFDGDALLEFATQMWRINAAHWGAIAFEADAENARCVASRMKAYGICGVEVISAAVGGASGSIDAGEIHNCRDEAGRGMVPVVALDEALDGIVPTFIKMDVEGAEREALAGAHAMIQRHRPKLAICAYHSSMDLVSIPLHIADRCLGYEVYLRHHSPGTLWETVCYGIPKL